MAATEYLTTPTPTPRSAWAAALLNLTGIGLGYGYLRRFGRALGAAAGTIALVALAFVTDASSAPWLWRAVAVVWLGAQAADGARLALRGPRPARGNALLPIWGGAAAVTVLVAGSLGYGAAERATFAAAVAAHAKGDCATARPAFDAVTGVYRLTLADDVPDAAARREECAAYTAASTAQDAGAVAAAEDGLRAFRRDHPGSVLEPHVDERLTTIALRRVDQAVTTLATQTGDARASTVRAAMATLLSIRRDLADAPSAARVPQVVQTLWAAAERPFADQQFCEVLPTLDYAVTLPEAETGAIVATAREHRPQAQLGCGLAEFRAGRFPQAASHMQDLLTDHPGDPAAAQARSVLTATDVAQATPDRIPVPAPLGTPGDRTVTFYNVTSTTLRLQITGATAEDVTVPGCPSCPASLPKLDTCPSPGGKPMQAVRLAGGLYHVLLRPTGSRSMNVRTLTAMDGDGFCVYAVESGPSI
jgi:hypothetical protein